MPGCGEGAYARHNFRFTIKEVNFSLNRWEVLACAPEKHVPDVLIESLFCLLRGPEIPLPFPQTLARVGKSGLALGIGVPANVVRVPMRQDDRVNVSRGNFLGLQIVKQSASGWG